GFDVTEAETPATAKGENVWFVIYAVGSFIYRMFIMLAIALLIASKLFFVGIALAIVSVAGTLVWPLLKGIRFLMTSPRRRRQRGRAIRRSAAAAAALAALLLAVPLPYASLMQGVVWAEDSATIRARSDGIVTQVATADGVIETGARLASA